MSNSALVALTTSMYGKSLTVAELQSRLKHPARFSQRNRDGYKSFRRMVLQGHIKVDQMVEDLMNEIDEALRRKHRG